MAVMATEIVPWATSPVARLRVERRPGDGMDGLCRALAAPAWLGAPVTDPDAAVDRRRFRTDLTVSLTDAEGRRVFRKAAFVDIGPVRRTRDGCTVEIAWRAASFAPLFPVFAGRLEAGDGRVALRGAYAPPGAVVGLLFDRAYLGRVASRTAAAFLDRLIAEAKRAGSAE